MDLILSAALYIAELQPIPMSQIMSCPDAQAVIGNLNEAEGLSDEQRMELIKVIMEHTPINCPVPQSA